MSIPFWEAFALGAVQGVTEFLPISSDGHLALLQLYWGHDADLSLTVLLHVGTFIATILVLFSKVRAALVDGLRALVAPRRFQETDGGRDALFVIVASIPTAIIGFSLKHTVEQLSSSPSAVALGFLGSAAVLVSTRFFKMGERDVPTHWGALLIGIAQGAAVLPGLSRSAMTIASLLWFGLKPRRAFELSFLLSLPAIFGAVLLEARHAFKDGSDPMPLVFGTFVAFVFGVGALFVMKALLSKGRVAGFALYLVPLAIATFAWGYARP